MRPIFTIHNLRASKCVDCRISHGKVDIAFKVPILNSVNRRQGTYVLFCYLGTLGREKKDGKGCFLFLSLSLWSFLTTGPGAPMLRLSVRASVHLSVCPHTTFERMKLRLCVAGATRSYARTYVRPRVHSVEDENLRLPFFLSFFLSFLSSSRSFFIFPPYLNYSSFSWK